MVWALRRGATPGVVRLAVGEAQLRRIALANLFPRYTGPREKRVIATHEGAGHLPRWRPRRGLPQTGGAVVIPPPVAPRSARPLVHGGALAAASQIRAAREAHPESRSAAWWPMSFGSAKSGTGPLGDLSQARRPAAHVSGRRCLGIRSRSVSFDYGAAVARRPRTGLASCSPTNAARHEVTSAISRDRSRRPCARLLDKHRNCRGGAADELLDATRSLGDTDHRVIERRSRPRRSRSPLRLTP